MKKKLMINGKEFEAQVVRDNNGVAITLDGKTSHYNLKGMIDDKIVILRDGKELKYETANLGNDQNQIFINGVEAIFSPLKKKKMNEAHISGPVSPMPGKVFKILVKDGQVVKKGESLLIIEAMKMEHTIKSDKDTTIKKVLYKEGDMVQGGVPLIEFN